MVDALIVTETVRLRLQRREALLASGAPDTPEAEAAMPLDSELVKLETNLTTERGPRAALIAQFGLTVRELALLDICVAVQVDPALESLVATCQGKPWRPVPTEALARRLYGLDAEAIFRPTGGLARWRMVAAVADPSGAACGYQADPRIVDWYFGTAALDAGLVERCHIPTDEILPAWDLHAEVRIVSELLQAGQPVRLSIIGPKGNGRAMAAQAFCAALGAAPLVIRGDALNEENFVRLQRFALLTGRVPIWQTSPVWPAFRTPVPLQIILAETTPNADTASFDYVIKLPAFTADLRLGYWQALTEAKAVPMALRHATPVELCSLAPLAKRPKMVELFLRQRALSDLDSIGHVKRAVLTWDDIVLPQEVADSLQDYACEARLQAGLMGQAEVRRLYAADAAPTALFTGPPGVGKTMAAECIAADLGLPLLVIDVSRTVSKYIGETAKNLSAIVDRARRFGCILFFDEADAFFAKRTDMKDSNDRYANADTNHLLQLIEGYEGPVILSTNKPGNIDEAFFRRIRHVIGFHRPDLEQRRQLWAHYAGVLAGPDAVAGLDAPLRLCAERFELTPAQIKGAVLTAHFTSLRAEIAMELPHLLGGVARELRKDGRTLPADLVLTTAKEVAHVA